MVSAMRVKSEYLNGRKGGGDFINIEATLTSLCEKQEEYDSPQASVQDKKVSHLRRDT